MPIRPARVLVVGSANVDFTIAAARLPAPGETVTDGTLLVNHGGKGANQAVAARRLGADVRFVGCVGADASGAAIRAGLVAEGIGVDGLVESAGEATGTALIVVDAAGENQITVAPGANRTLTVAQVEARADDFAWADVVACQLEIPLPCVHAALAAARRHGAVTILNPAPVPSARLDMLPLVDYLTPNEGEASRLSALDVRAPADAIPAAKALRAAGARTVVVTLGENGAAAVGDETMTVPAVKVTAIDTTAAGDAFNGGLAVALAEGRPLREALGFATATAALTCTRRGAQASLPCRDDVEALLRG
ncbi:MAG: ribokinase [Candidatus Rokubacteria bacterium]|nr:ribokinase [Candidatus Rokubacteria bacterium]